MPKRPLSAYNIFFRKERQVLLGQDAEKHVITDQSRRKHRKTHGKIGFAEMARLVALRWSKLDTTTKQGFEEQANLEKARYFQLLEVWKQAQESDPTEEPTETTEYMEDEPIIREGRQSDRGRQVARPMEASPRLPQQQALPQTVSQPETAQFSTMFQREDDYINEPRFHSRNAYFSAFNASLPANFGGNAPITAMRGRASLPGYLPSHYGDNAPYTMPQGRASLSGGPPDAYRVPPRAHNPRLDSGVWPPQAASTGFGEDPFYSQAQHCENDRIREMEEMYRIHLAEAALLRERLGLRGDTGTDIDHLRQQPGAYPGRMQIQARRASNIPGGMTDTGKDIDPLRQQPVAYPGRMQMQARRASDTPGGMSDTGTAIDHLRQQRGAYPGLMQMQASRASDAPGGMLDTDRGQANMAEMLIIERAQAARRADMMALQRVLENERILRQEEELRQRRGL